MRLIIKDIKFGEYEYPNKIIAMAQISDTILEKMKASKILCNIKFDPKIVALYFDNVPDKDPKRMFLSEKKNHLPMPENDPRRIKLGRSYLETYRLSLAQSDLVWKELINGTLDKLGVSCNILVQEFSDDPNSLITVRDGFQWGEWKYKDKSSPVEVGK